MEPGIYGAAVREGQARLVRVEALLSRGLRRVVLVGMPDAVAREARERLPAALEHHGFAFPRGKVLFNLVPAQWPKGGLPLDLALAIAVLAAGGQVRLPPDPLLFLAELDLEGRLRPPARGTLLAALACRGHARGLVTAPAAASEAALAPGVPVWPAADLAEVAALLRHPERRARQAPPIPRAASRAERRMRLDDVRGQAQARLAAIVSAAGRHPLLLEGPPGTGKSLLARRVPLLLPPLEPAEALELAQVEAQLGPVPEMPCRPPFRAPHASLSAQGLLGGGHPLRPGEISRAHHGVLFLDELPEFARPALEGLRQPLEDRSVHIQRAREGATFPADVLLVAARNPCPCGFLTHGRIACRCTPTQVERYRNRTSGPLLDRFDLFAEMGPVGGRELRGPPTSPRDEEAHERLERAAAARKRRADAGLQSWNGAATREEIADQGIEPAAEERLVHAVEEWQLSGRGALRCLRVARTLADLAGRRRVARDDVTLALSYRQRAGAAEPSRAQSARPPQ